MTVLEWDKVGDRVYQTGVDRGVLYLKDGTAVPWNGLTSVDDGNNSELKSYYMDGIKILESVTPGDFVGKLTAFTYPEEFDQLQGIVAAAEGLFFHEQPGKSFNLSYRTKIGNDVDGDTHGYKVHLLYNLVAVPDSASYGTINNSIAPIEFAWSLTGTPPIISGHRPMVHVSFDSTMIEPEALEIIENILYGTDTTEPRFPPINEIASLFNIFGALIIVDNGDGTWTAIDQGDNYISMIDGTTFQIDDADATYLDATTYEISSTNEE